MQSAAKEYLPPADLMRHYGKIRFFWDLPTDFVHWYGPSAKFLNLDLPLLTGTNYLNRITPDQFWWRLEKMGPQANNAYRCHYMLLLANNEACYIEEEGEVLRNEQGFPIMVKGSIQAMKPSDQKNLKDLSGYDTLTGFPKYEVLLENLTSIIEVDKKILTSGGYLCISINCLSWVYFLFGFETLQKVIKAVGKQLRKHIRFNDVIGRISGCCFGIIMRENDEGGIFKLAERLQLACQEIEIKTPNSVFYPTISVGGTLFDSSLSSIEIMKQAERNLFEMQNIKSSGPYVQKPQMGLPLPVNQSLLATGKPRFSDLKHSLEVHVKNSASNLKKTLVS
jgi:diguanylate cyclase (GGDEF)-like protein